MNVKNETNCKIYNWFTGIDDRLDLPIHESITS